MNNREPIQCIEYIKENILNSSGDKQ